MSKATRIQKPRSYPTPEGKRLNLAAIARRFKTTAGSFLTRNSRGWPHLGGTVLVCQKMRYGKGRGEEEGTWLESEVVEALCPEVYPFQCGSGRWLSEGIYSEGDLVFYTAREAMNHHRWLRHTHLLRWEPPHRCRYLPEGRPIDLRRVPPPPTVRCPHEEIAVYRAGDLREIAIAVSTSREEAIEKDGMRWASGRHLTDMLQIPSGRKWLYHWSNRESRVRPRERALRSTPEVRPKRGMGGWTEVPYYCIEDAKTILRGEESEEPDYVRAAAFLRELIRRRPLTFHDVMVAAKAAGFARHQIKKGRVHAGILTTPNWFFGSGSKSWWHLPGQEIPQGESPINDEILPLSEDDAIPTRKRGHYKSKKAILEKLAFCYGEYRLVGRVRERVLADAKCFGKQAPKQVNEITILSERFANKCGYPIVPEGAEQTRLLGLYRRGDLIPSHLRS